MTKQTPYILAVIMILSLVFCGCGKDQERPQKQNPRIQEKSDVDSPGEIVGEDDVPMILIPAGEFQMGSGGAAHAVYTDAFYMDKYGGTGGKDKWQYIAALRRTVMVCMI